MFDAALDGSFRALYVQGEDIAQSDPNVNHVHAALASLDLVVVQDLFLNETSKFAHVLLPGTSFLEKDGTFTNAERRINRVRPVMEPKTGKHEHDIVCEIATAMGYPMSYDHPRDIMAEIAATTPTFAGVSFDLLDEVGSVQWPCNEKAPLGHADDARRRVRARQGRVRRDHATSRRSSAAPASSRSSSRPVGSSASTTSARRLGARANVAWHPEDILEIHPHDAEDRGIRDGDEVSLASRVGQTSLHAKLSDRMPVGVVYTTFHHPITGANVVTTEHSDWATNCPEYKVTAVQVGLRHPRVDFAADGASEDYSGVMVD